MKVIIDRDVSMTARDGVLLRADIFRPADDGVHPVLLTRTPYGKQFEQFSDTFGQPLINLTERGYAVVIQDCRGTGASGGDFEFYINEGTDGSDTVDWCAAQPWSNGKVGMFGGSYVSTTQFTTAFEAPEALKVIAGAVSPAQYYGELAYRGGAFCLAVSYQWTWARALDQIVRSGQTPPPGFPTDTSRSGDALTTLPVRDLLALLPASTPGHLKDWLDHPTLDDYWRKISYDGKYPRAKTPGLHVAGWFDIFLSGTLQNYTAMRDGSATPESRNSQHLIVGPWTHTNWTGRHADRSFSGTAAAPAGLGAAHSALYDHYLNEGPRPDLPAVSIYVMGADEWRDEVSWPLPDTDYRRYYLRAGADPDGRGQLSSESPDAEEPHRYIYDPLDPVPTLGGQTLIAHELNEGPVDQRPNDIRADVLIFETTPLTDPLEVIGPITFHAFLAISTPDTDLTAALSDVHPDGTANLLADGILRLRYRNSFEAPESITPGAVYEVEVDLVATANVFRTGHRIRLDVSSSNFPRYDRNSNSGGEIALAGPDDMVPCHVTLFHDQSRPSHLRLPIIERAGSASD